MEIFCLDEQKSVDISQENIPLFVQTVLRLEKQSAAELSVTFVEKDVISALHMRFFNDSSVTDCISIPMDEDADALEHPEHRVLGDVFVCPAVALDYVRENGGDVYEELSLYLLHGLLHLLGYDDISEEDASEMRRAEKRHLEQLKKDNLLLQAKLI